MSSAAISAAASTVIPAINVHPHGGHGHKKGVEADSENDTDTTIGQTPATTNQNLFSSLLQSLEQVTGVQPTSSTSGAASVTAGAAAGTGATSAASAATTAAAGVTPATVTATPASAQALARMSHSVQSFLQNLQTSQSPVGGTVNANA
jgi:hypothetical protein